MPIIVASVLALMLSSPTAGAEGNFAITSEVPTLSELDQQVKLLVATAAPDNVKADQLEGGARALVVPKMVYRVGGFFWGPERFEHRRPDRKPTTATSTLRRHQRQLGRALLSSRSSRSGDVSTVGELANQVTVAMAFRLWDCRFPAISTEATMIEVRGARQMVRIAACSTHGGSGGSGSSVTRNYSV